MANFFIVLPLDGLPHADKDPDDPSASYTLDWSVYLASIGETSVASCTVTTETGLLNVGSCAVSGALTTQLYSGGTRNQAYRSTYQITSAPNARTKSQTVVIDVKDQ